MYTALHWAVIRGQEKICELLLSKMSKETINAVDKNGYKALHYAARNGHEKICELLIKENPKFLDDVDKNGNTA